MKTRTTANTYHKDANRVALLSKIHFDFKQSCGTEPPFQNPLWDNRLWSTKS
jgi:peptide methionine sulfoxide reductase MsrB